MVRHLTRGLGLLEEAEFNARRDAEQMAKTVTDFHGALDKIQAIHDESWTKESFQIELTRALTTIENARMEWNSARLKFAILAGEMKDEAKADDAPPPAVSPFANMSLGELCKIGFAMTWPLVLVALAAIGLMVALLLRH
jgi:hypothetical protein